MDYRRIIVYGTALFFAFFLVPFAWLKLFLAVSFIIFCDLSLPHIVKNMLARLFVTFLFIAEFMLTPFAHAVQNVLDLDKNGRLWISSIILLSGVFWINALLKVSSIPKNNFSADKKSEQTLPRILNKSYPFLILSTLICLLLKPTLDVDFSYGGDEHYHAMSIILCQRLFFLIFEIPESYIFLLIILSLAIITYLINCHKINRLYLHGMTILLIITVGIWLLIVWEHVTLDSLVIERALRYPCSEPWISAILGFLDYSFWVSYQTNYHEGINNFGVMRLLPALSYMLLNYVIYKHLTNICGSIYSTIITLTISTMPVLLYESTLLYLEMPLVLAVLIVLLDSEKIMSSQPEELVHRTSFYALTSIQFFKESGFMIAIALVLLRLWRRYVEIKNSDENSSLSSFLKRELTISFIWLLGGFVYLMARSLTSYRPYNFHPENIFNLNLWQKSLSMLFEQYHLFVLIPVFAGFLVRTREKYVVQIAIAVVIWLFYFFEDPQWIGLARFNLLIAPAIICLLISIFSIMYKESNKVCLFVLTILLMIINLCSLPFDIQGFRKDFGGSGERWYDWSRCLSDIKREKKNARIIVANMPFKFGFGLVFAKLNWYPALSEMRPLIQGKEVDDFKACLDIFDKSEVDFMIYRYEDLFEDESGIIEEFVKQRRFIIFARYPSAAGGLFVIRKQTGS